MALATAKGVAAGIKAIAIKYEIPFDKVAVTFSIPFSMAIVKAFDVPVSKTKEFIQQASDESGFDLTQED